MTIDKLSHEQRLGLVALLELVAMSDGTVSDGEVAQINKVANELGDEAYRSLLDEADARFADTAALKDFLEAIHDRQSRETIYGFIMEEAMSSPTVVSRHEIIEWLASTWNIEARELESNSE